MNKTAIFLIVLLMISISFLSGCNEQKQKDNEENVPKSEPIAECSSSITEGLYPLIVQFTGSGIDLDGIIVSYYWDFGDGNNSWEQNPIHTFQKYGQYIVRLKVYDNDGLTDVDELTINVLKIITIFANVSGYVYDNLDGKSGYNITSGDKPIYNAMILFYKVKKFNETQIANGKLVIEEVDSSPLEIGFTNESGYYIIFELLPGYYAVNTYIEDYLIYQKIIAFEPGENTLEIVKTY